MNVTSIPDLIERYGSMTRAAEATGLSEYVIMKYSTDRLMLTHVIFNDRLMTTGSRHSRKIQYMDCARSTGRKPLVQGRKLKKGMKLRETCKRGHAMTPDNSYITAQGYAVCRRCKAGDTEEC